MQIEADLLVILLSENFVGLFGIGLEGYKPILEFLYLVEVFFSHFDWHFVQLVEYSSKVFNAVRDLLHNCLD